MTTCKLIEGKTEEEERQICLNCPYLQCVHDLEKSSVTLSTKSNNNNRKREHMELAIKEKFIVSTTSGN